MPRRAWCRAVEVGLLSAYKAAGGPCPQGDQPFLGRGTAVIRSRLVGGRAPVGSIGLPELTMLILPTVMSLSLGWRGAQGHQEKWPFYCEVADFDAPVGGCVQMGPHRPHEDSGSLEGLASRSFNLFLALDELEPVCL